MPTLSFWFKDCELGFRQEARGQEKKALPSEVLTHDSIKKSVKGTKRELSFPTPTPKHGG